MCGFELCSGSQCSTDVSQSASPNPNYKLPVVLETIFATFSVLSVALW
jgi:hypothetical protein